MDKINIHKFLDKPFGQFLLFFILVFIILIPVLARNHIFFQSDNLNWSYPNLIFYQEAINSNQSFFWNPYIFSGFPTFISVTGGYLSPIFYFFFKLFDPFKAYHWLIFLNLVLGGFLLTRLLIHFKISSIPALIGGISYILSSRALFTDLPVINYLPLLPALVWLLVLCYDRDSWKPVFFGFLLVYFIIVSVHYNWQLIVFGGGLIFSLFYPWIKGEINYKKYLILASKYLIMILGGSLLAFPLILSLIHYLPYSYQATGLSYNEAMVGSANFFDFINFFLPYFDPPRLSSGAQFYLGALPLFFIIFSFVLFKRKRIVSFFTSVFIFCILITVNHSPIFWIMQKLPILKFFRGPGRWMALGFFAASILAGIGAENLLNTDFEKFKIRLVKIFKWLILTIIFISLILNTINYFFGAQILNLVKNYFDQNFYQKTTGLPLEHYHLIINQTYFNFIRLVSFTNLKFLFPLIILLLSYLVINFFVIKKQKQGYFYITTLLIVIINLILILPFGYQTVSRQIFDYRPKIAEYILNDNGKIFTFLPGFSEFDRLITPYNPDSKQIFIFQSEILTPNISMFYKIKTADGFNSLMPKRMAEILALLGSDRSVTGQKLSEVRIPLADKIKLFRERLSLIDLLGIKYIISAYKIEDKNLNNVFQTEITDYNIPLYLYQNKNSLPEIYFAKKISFLKPEAEENNFQLITKKGNNFNNTTFIECFNCQDTKEPLNSSIKIIKEENGYLKIRTSNQNAGWLVFNQNSLPGWQAEIDGNITNIYNANYLFQTIFIPTGEHDIIFQYKPFDIKKNS